MSHKARIFMVCVIFILGVALFSYYAAFYPIDLTPQAKGQELKITSGSVKNTSTDKPGQEKSGQSKKARSEGKSSRRAGAI